MSGADDSVAIIALLVSLIALVIATVQLLQIVLGTAEGFRGTNREIMGIFAQSRDRFFHWTELRYETKFSTPHFTFQCPSNHDSLLSQRADSSSAIKDHGDFLIPASQVLSIDLGGNRVHDISLLIRSSSRISRLQRFLQLLEHWAGSSANYSVSPRSWAYISSWLVLLEQLYKDNEKFHQKNGKVTYMYHRQRPGTLRFGPDRTHIRYPAIESHTRSWDLLPPGVVRPLASISMGDLLTLCFRLRINVSNLSTREFNADGFGNNFSSLQIQGIGMVVQYRYDRTKDDADTYYQADTKFIPCENTDKLAFGIIPENTQLGTEEWRLSGEQGGQHITEAMRANLQRLGISESPLEMVTSNKEYLKNDAGQTFGEAVLLLAPFMPIDGLGIVKFQPPMTSEWFKHSLLYIREGRIILRHRLNEMRANTEDNQILSPVKRPAMPPLMRDFASQQQLRWIAHVFDFFERQYTEEFYSIPGFLPMFMKNAANPKSHDCLRQMRSAYTDTDNYLASLFNQKNCIPTYACLVAAHFEMAIKVHGDVKREVRENKENGSRGDSDWNSPTFRDQKTSHRLWPWKTEIVHRYIDHAMEQRTIVDSYRKKSDDLRDERGLRPAALSDEEIRNGWYTMMLRACLWAMTHHAIWRPNLPFPSRYWGDNTLVFIA